MSVARQLIRLRFILAPLTCILSLGTQLTPVFAHEGHAALPTKGATINREKGLLTLSPSAHKTLGVKTAEAELLQPDQDVLAYASLVSPWQQHAFATSRIGGRVITVHVKAGQTVKAGQILAEIESLELESLQLELVNAQAALDLSTKILESIEPLLADQAIPAKDVFEAQTKHEEHQFTVAIARSKLLNLGFSSDEVDRLKKGSAAESPGSLPLLSPVSGTVIHLEMTVGKMVEPSEHLAEIVDLSKVWVQIGVLEKDLSRIAVGQKVDLRLAAFPNRKITSQVMAIVPYLDPESHLGSVWAELKNPEGVEPEFLPGMYGQAQITVSKPGKLVAIPPSALITDGAERFVLVEEAATARAYEYRKQNVVVALQTTSRVYLRDRAVFAGDRVITAGAHELATFFVSGVLKLSAEAAANAGLQIAPVRAGTVEHVIELEGTIEIPPEYRAQVSTPVAGILDKLLVEQGQLVKKGESVAEIASPEFQDLQLEYLQSSLQTELTAKLLERRRKLADTQSLARRQYWETEGQQKTFINRRDTAQHKLESIGVSSAELEAIVKEQRLLKTLSLRSPIDGIVVQFDKTLGQALLANEAVFEIHNLDRVWVQGYLAERDFASVRIGQVARVRLVSDPGKVLEGKVVRSGRVFGSENRTLSVWVELDNTFKNQLQQNMFARLTLVVGKEKPILSVPLSAITREATRSYVFVKKEDGSFDRRLVTLGKEDDRFVQVTKGLAAGEKIAVAGVSDLQTAYASIR